MLGALPGRDPRFAINDVGMQHYAPRRTVMTHVTRIRSAAAPAFMLMLFLFQPGQGQSKPAPADSENSVSQAPHKRLLYSKAFVIDDRLSALRREPGLQSEVIRRLRLGHTVYIVATSKPKADQPRFCRIAVTRRTRGWIHEAALAVQGRAGEDQRIMKLIENGADGIDRISLCRILTERFPQSRLLPKAFLAMGNEAERAAQTLSQRARKRVGDAGEENANASSRDYFMSDAGLDRYSKLRIVFDFNESTSEYVYDGKAYREVIRRFPEGEEAKLARERLELAKQKLARRQ
jgi:hypothetical protein